MQTNELIQTWGKQFPNKEVSRKMAESASSVMSNSVNTQNQVSAVQRINQTEESEKTEQVMEPMLLEEHEFGKMPRSITNLLNCFKRRKQPPDINDILVGFLYILMLESGFVPKDCQELVLDHDFNYQRILRLSKILPEPWKKDGCYRLYFQLHFAPDCICTLFCMPVADDMIINCTVKDMGKYTLLVDPLSYIVNLKNEAQTILLQNLAHLARKFKTTIAFPAKIDIVSARGGICACLHDLPHEVLIKIMSFLTIQEVMVFANTCKVVCQSALDSSLWVKLLDWNFKKRNIFKTYDELKFLYEIKYARELSKIIVKGTGY